MRRNRGAGRRAAGKVNGLIAYARIKRHFVVPDKALPIVENHAREPGISLEEEYSPHCRVF